MEMTVVSTIMWKITNSNISYFRLVDCSLTIDECLFMTFDLLDFSLLCCCLLSTTPLERDKEIMILKQLSFEHQVISHAHDLLLVE